MQLLSTLSLALAASAAAFNAPMVARPAAPAVGRVADINMGASIRELRDRVGSVKNTKKITSAMKLVAAAKVRRAQEAVLRSRPFSETLERILGGLLERVKTDGLVVITGDRGLCGGYNAQAIKLAETRIAELKAQGVGAELILVGNKGGSYFKRRATPIRSAQACGQAPTADQSSNIATELLSSFYSGEVDRVELIYTQFNSMIAFTPEKETIPAAAPQQFVPDMIFEQEPSQLLNAILPLYINGQLLRTQQESVASELAARMSAMQSATDNAKDLQGRLESEMNRARQAKITQELMEIIAGADATN